MTPELVQLWLPKNDSLHGAVDNQEMMRNVFYCIPLVFSGRETIEISFLNKLFNLIFISLILFSYKLVKSRRSDSIE